MRTWIAIIFTSPLLSGCFVSGSIEDLTPRVIQRSATNEVISAAETNQKTNGKYEISHAAGNITGRVQAKTADGYHVFMSVQGSVFSEDIQR